MKMSSSLAIALIVISLLMFGVAFVMRNMAAVPANAMQSTVAVGIQPIQAQMPDPVAIPFTSDPPVRFMTAEEEAQFDNHEWLAVAYDRGVKNVWGGAWFPCRHIDASTLTFNTIRTDPALAVWVGLGPSGQTDIIDECSKP